MTSTVIAPLRDMAGDGKSDEIHAGHDGHGAITCLGGYDPWAE